MAAIIEKKSYPAEVFAPYPDILTIHVLVGGLRSKARFDLFEFGMSDLATPWLGTSTSVSSI